MRIVFAGTPDPAVVALQHLIDSARLGESAFFSSSSMARGGTSAGSDFAWR